MTSWNLLVDWTVNSTRNTIRWPLTVTGDSGHTTYRPDGTSSSAPITDIAPDHWTPWQPHHGRPWGAEDRLAIAVHGGPSGVQVQHGWGDEERYVAARKSKDHAALLYELLGLTVFVPLMRSDQIPIATVRGDQTFILACTSLPRLRELDAPQVDPEQALALRT